jgi:hypothetical protein
MYLIPASPRVFNIKWDRDHTRYAPAQLPATATSAVRAGAAVAKIPYPRSSAIPFGRPVDTSACMGCNCSGRGIGAPPQKRMGSNMRGLYGLRGADYNSATNYIFTAEPASQVQAVAQAMIAEGYNAGIVNNLVGAGATAEDLQNLWDNYTNSANANDPDGFGRPALQLLQTIQSLHPQLGVANRPNLPPLTYAQGVQAIPGVISNFASSVLQDVASVFTPPAGPRPPTTGVPWYWWLLGGAVGLELLRNA